MATCFLGFNFVTPCSTNEVSHSNKLQAEASDNIIFFAVGMLLSSCEDNGQVPKEDQVIEEARSSKFLRGIRVVVPGITMACN